MCNSSYYGYHNIFAPLWSFEERVINKTATIRCLCIGHFLGAFRNASRNQSSKGCANQRPPDVKLTLVSTVPDNATALAQCNKWLFTTRERKPSTTSVGALAQVPRHSVDFHRPGSQTYRYRNIYHYHDKYGRTVAAAISQQYRPQDCRSLHQDGGSGP